MVNRQLVDWIKEAKAGGFSDSEIYKLLVQKGHKPNIVSEAMNFVKSQSKTIQTKKPGQNLKKQDKPQNQKDVILPSVKKTKEDLDAKPPEIEIPKPSDGMIVQPPEKSSKLPVILGLIFILMIVSGIIGYFIYINPSWLYFNNSSSFDMMAGSENISGATVEIGDCSELPDKLENCEVFVCEFKHPFTGEMMTRQINGLEDGFCNYEEEMPNGGKMECSYDDDYMKAVAQYYRDVAAAESVGTELNSSSVIYTINGEEVDNPLQKAMDSGICNVLIEY